MKRFIGVAILTLATLSGHATDDVRFVVERIEVRGVQRAQPEIVISESRLVAGNEYTESEVDEATWRVRRLPFVRDASASLEKGTERGHYVLVFTVDETLPFFVGLLTDDETIADAETGILAGWRWFPGTESVFHVAATLADNEGVQVGYTRYGLLGPGSFVHASLRYGLWDSVNESDEGLLTGRVLLAIPIGANDALRLGLSSDARNVNRVDGSEDALREEMLELLWIRDRTNDPFFPTDGRTITAGVEYSIEESLLFFSPVGGEGPIEELETEIERATIVGSFLQFRPVGEASTIWGSALVKAGRNEWKDINGRDRDSFEGTLRAGWAGGPSSWMTNPSRTMRFELGAIYEYRRNSSGDGIFRTTAEQAGFRAGFAFRNDWAVVRFFAEWFPHEDFRFRSDSPVAGPIAERWLHEEARR